jgi:hypothetical protein
MVYQVLKSINVIPMLEEQDLAKEYKPLKVSPETHRELTNLGKKNESYDEIIKRLIIFYKENQKAS